MIRPNCQICEENQHKYKCPACEAKYCSVPCYKKHKEVCLPREKSNGNDKSGAVSGQISEKEEGEISPSENDSPVNTNEDRVSLESLQRLGHSEEMKSLLENPHLRPMLTSLDSSTNSAADIATAMQIPIFTEFADTCLSIVKPDPDVPKIISDQIANGS